jgi:hypothetical protein
LAALAKVLAGKSRRNQVAWRKFFDQSNIATDGNAREPRLQDGVRGIVYFYQHDRLVPALRQTSLDSANASK